MEALRTWTHPILENQNLNTRTTHTMTPHLLLFGASGGIATALRALAENHEWNVTAATRHPDTLSDMGPNTLAVEADGTTSSGAREAFDRAEDRHGPPTAVVNCIGGVMLKPLHKTSSREFTDTMRLHVFSSFAILKEAVTRMESGSGATLVSTAAVAAGLPNHEAIATAKGALEGLVRSAAATYASKGIRVNAVAPGLVETPATKRLCQGPARGVSEKMHPLGRIGKPGDIASALFWLSHPDQSWVTGQILHVDGGLAHLRTRPD